MPSSDCSFSGFGVQANPHLYCTPNSDDVNEENVEDFEAKVLALRPQHVRIFFRQQWFDGEADAISQGDERIADSFIRACRLAQRAGATINVTYWNGPWPKPEEQMAAFAKTLDEKLSNSSFATAHSDRNTKDNNSAFIGLRRIASTSRPTKWSSSSWSKSQPRSIGFPRNHERYLPQWSRSERV